MGLADAAVNEIPRQKDVYKRQVVPFAEAVHDRVMMEVFRGCIRGCRFCQAGTIYRPVREKSPKVIDQCCRALVAVSYTHLQVLFERRGRVVARETLMQRLWETDLFVDENTLTVNIARLRRKLEAKGVRDLIVTKKGLGYMVE